MEGYIKALIDTHKRRLGKIISTDEKEEIEDRIEELEGILGYYQQEFKKAEQKISSFFTSCKAKDLPERVRKACEGEYEEATAY